MSIGSFAVRIALSVAGVLLAASASRPVGAAAQDQPALHANHKELSGAFIEVVREATKRFQDSAVAEDEGYVVHFGCVSGPDEGAMGIHMVNFEMVGDPALDPNRPELLLYEPLPDGRLKLTGADYLVLADAWHAAGNASPPEMMGQLFQYFEAPNRFGLPPFYTLHVWAWKPNPHGAFVNWHPKVSCTAFNPPS